MLSGTDYGFAAMLYLRGLSGHTAAFEWPRRLGVVHRTGNKVTVRVARKVETCR